MTRAAVLGALIGVLLGGAYVLLLIRGLGSPDSGELERTIFAVSVIALIGAVVGGGLSYIQRKMRH